MIRSFFLSVRACLFYPFYVVSLIVYACICLVVGMFLPIIPRYRFFLIWNRMVLWWLKVTCGITHEIIGRENVPPAPYVVLSNHQSPWETLYLYVLFMPICATLKQELLRIPFFGWSLMMLKPIAIDRSKTREARQTLLNEGPKRIAEGISVLVFPEGTRVDPDKQKRYTSGGAELAIEAKTIIIPVAHNAGHYWPAHKLIKHPGTIRVIIGKPIETAGREPRELTQQVENWIRSQFS